MKLLVFLLPILLFISCGNENGEEDSDPVPEIVESVKAPTNLTVIDISNSGSGSDFELSFNPPAKTSIIEDYRVFVVKKTTLENFDSLAAINTSISNYTVFTVSSKGSRLTFMATVKDSDGDLITEGIAYNLFVMSMSKDDMGGQLSEPSSEITLVKLTAVKHLTDFINAGSGGMDIDADGNIYMGDFGTSLSGGGNKVYKITPNGKVSVFARGVNGASGNTFDAEGNLYQANITGGTISKITPDGIVSHFATIASAPVGLAFDSNKDLIVCGCGDNTLRKVDVNGNVSLFSQDPLLSCPNGLAIDENDIIYVANFNNGRVLKIDPVGNATVLANIPGGNNGHLRFLNSDLYITARGASQVYRIDINDGTFEKIVGSGGRGFMNGDALNATLNLPNDLVFSPDGKKLYINDLHPDATGSVISPVSIRVVDIVN